MSPTFAQLGVPQSIVEALARRGIVKPFEIQAATITDAMAGRDVSGRAPTRVRQNACLRHPVGSRSQKGRTSQTQSSRSGTNA